MAPRGRVLVTGGCGFIGSHVVRALLDASVAEVVDLDALTYAGRIENLGVAAADPRHRLIHGDVADAAAVDEAAEGCDAILHLAAETHVDRSILGGDEFLRTNVIGTKRVLDWIVAHRQTRLVHVSTDEVYGDLPSGRRATERSPLAASSPYAASKAAADLLVTAYARTYDIDAVVVRPANAYGPYQHPEKLIPRLTINALRGDPLPVYGDGLQEREFTHVTDVVAAILVALDHGMRGGVYNVSAETACINRETAQRIAALAGASPDLVRHVADRPGHDRRYAVDAGRMRALGWAPRVAFVEGLAATVDWYRTSSAWWEPIADGAPARSAPG